MFGRVLSVARLDPHDRYKGVDTLIEAWPRVVADQPDAELIVVGEGADRARLEALARANGTDSRVRFAGRIDDSELQELYRTAAVFALPIRVAGRGRPRQSVKPRPRGTGASRIPVSSVRYAYPRPGCHVVVGSRVS